MYPFLQEIEKQISTIYKFRIQRELILKKLINFNSHKILGIHFLGTTQPISSVKIILFLHPV